MDETDDLIVIPPEQLALATPAEQEQYRLYLISKALESDDWRAVLPAVVPDYASVPFAPHHHDLWDWVWDIDLNDRPQPFCAIWPRGGGKAVDMSATLPTPYGWKQMTEITVGDQVLDERGRPCTVVDMSPIERKSAYRVSFKGGSSEVVSGDHLWSVLDRRSRRVMASNCGGIIPEWASWVHHDRPVTLCEVEGCRYRVRRRGPDRERWCQTHWYRNDRYGDPLGGPPMRRRSGSAFTGSREGRKTYSARSMTTEEIIEDGLLDGREWQFAIPVAEAWDLPEVDLPIDPYILGAWLGDGFSSSGNIGMLVDDAEEMFAGFEASSTPQKLKSNRVFGIYRFPGLTSLLKECDLLMNKHVPEIYLRASIKQRMALLQGLMDTDGTPHRNAASFTNTNERVARAVHELAVSLGYRASINEYRAKLGGEDNGPAWRVRIAGARADVFRLERKRSKLTAEPMSMNDRLHYITGIERVEDRDVRCLVVDSPNHLFLLGRDAIPTHNSSSAEMAVAMMGARGKRRYVLYVSETQDQSDDHVANVAAILEGKEIEFAYPEVGQRMLGKFGQSKGWRRNRIRTATGFTVDAIGLDTAARGIKLESMRPDMLVLDDIDSETDSEQATAKKIKTITYKLIPAGSRNCAILAIQNKVHDDSIFARLADGRADFMRGRKVCGPIPAVYDLEWEDVGGTFTIVGGEPSWPEGQGIGTCQAMMNDMGLTAFLAECQHSTLPPAGGMFDHIGWSDIRVSQAEVPELKRVVVWLDPAVTDTKQSDSQGIICDGLGRDGLIYRLWCWEGRTNPLAALKRAISKAVEYGADTVGVETDQGGDTWKTVYHQACEELRAEGILVGSAPRYSEKKASGGHGGKATRAQRMLVDYERNKFRHVDGTISTLEVALLRFPKVKPFDLVDASYYSWLDLTKGTRRKATYRSPATMTVGAYSPN